MSGSLENSVRCLLMGLAKVQMAHHLSLMILRSLTSMNKYWLNTTASELQLQPKPKVVVNPLLLEVTSSSCGPSQPFPNFLLGLDSRLLETQIMNTPKSYKELRITSSSIQVMLMLKYSRERANSCISSTKHGTPREIRYLSQCHLRVTKTCL